MINELGCMRFLISSRIVFFACLLLMVAQGFQSFAQTSVITGRVIDAVTAEPLPFAHVFVNQTTIGTVTDNHGVYALKSIPIGENTIVFSFVGYKSHQLKIQLKGDETSSMNIRLQPDDKQLETVEVTGTRDKEWEKQVKKFENVFLGKTKFAESTKIVNPWTLDFKESKLNGTDVFMATSSKPLEIENNALGYRVFYYLKSMVANSGGYSITGEVRFEEINSDDPKIVKTWSQNRLNAYEGSLRHLLKSIIDGNVREEGFNLYIGMRGYENSLSRTAVFSEQLNKSIESFSPENSVTQGKAEGEFIIPLKQRVEIHYIQGRPAMKIYNDIFCPVSWLEVNEGFLRVNSNGIVLNPPFAIVSGAMYDDRVANLLPYNYSQN
jgi:hypothetical protein